MLQGGAPVRWRSLFISTTFGLIKGGYIWRIIQQLVILVIVSLQPQGYPIFFVGELTPVTNQDQLWSVAWSSKYKPTPGTGNVMVPMKYRALVLQLFKNEALRLLFVGRCPRCWKYGLPKITGSTVLKTVVNHPSNHHLIIYRCQKKHQFLLGWSITLFWPQPAVFLGG